MSYTINRFNGTQLIVLEDGTIDTSTSLSFIGRNYIGYGELQNENLLFLLENFANNNPPNRPIFGQTWYNTSTQNLNVYNGTEWKVVGSASVSQEAPTSGSGAFWYNSVSDQLFVFDEEWKLIGPEAVSGFGVTRLRSRTISGNSVLRPISELLVDNETLAIISNDDFTIDSTNTVDGFSSIQRGINLSNKTVNGSKLFNFVGDLVGNAQTATKLKNGISINGTFFTGETDVVIKSSTTGKLLAGDYITGSDFDGSTNITWNVNASSNNIIGSVVARDSVGNFFANTITADLIGDVTGNVTAVSGTSTFDVIQANSFIGNIISGNAFSATKLETARSINGVSFDGTSNITITSAANTLTGDVLSPSVLYSSLVQLGLLNSLRTKDAGVGVGDNNVLRLFADTGDQAKIRNDIANKALDIEVKDSTRVSGYGKFQFLPSSKSLDLSGDNVPSFIPSENNVYTLGLSTNKWKSVWSSNYYGAGADLAEKYHADNEYSPGTVLMFGGEKEVTLATEDTSRVAGVVSSDPAYVMNSDLTADKTAIVALQGRVPVKVKGRIQKGDMIVSAGSGYAKSCAEPQLGTVLGKALEDFDGVEGIIEVVVGRL
jgi:hypothetical protein